MSSQLDFVQ